MDTQINSESNNFEVLIIKPNIVEHLDYNRVDYISEILSVDCYKNTTTTAASIGLLFAEYLNSENYIGCNAQTNICFETSEHLYEICYLDIPEDKKSNQTYNQIASILDITNQQIFGTAILLKTYLPIDNLNMSLVNSSKDDIKKILESRVNHLGVFIDTDGNLKSINFRDIDPKLRELLDEDPKDLGKIEIPFLKHNFIMYHVKDSLDEENKLVANIAQKKISGDVFIISMLTESIFTDITIDEVKKMLAISRLGEEAWKSRPEDDSEERDESGRIIIKSKHRILHNKFNQLGNLD